jgi:hypothetical protein
MGSAVIDVGAVDAGGFESCFFGGGHLIAHECEEWRNDECGAVSSLSEGGCSGPVDGAFPQPVACTTRTRATGWRMAVTASS